jgi:acyl-CoA hydrolase
MPKNRKNENPSTQEENFSSLPFHSVATRLIMSGDLNAANTLFGGRLIQWVDEAASVYVMELLRTHHIVTKKISEVL